MQVNLFKRKSSLSAIEAYEELAEQLNGDQQKIAEYIEQQCNKAREEKNMWGRFMMSNYWNHQKNLHLQKIKK